jgi:hypothetical protein
VILVNRDFVPLLATIRPRLENLKAVIVMDDGSEPAASPDWICAEYESMTASAAVDCDFPDLTSRPSQPCFTLQAPRVYRKRSASAIAESFGV